MLMRCSILCVLIFVLQLVHVQLQGQHPWANSTLLTVETAENCLRECRFVKALCVNDVRIFECYAFAFNVMHPQCAQEITNTSQLIQNADTLKQKNSPVDACLLLKTCLLLELKEIKKQQRGQQKITRLAITSTGISDSLSTETSGPRKRTIKPKLAPRKKRGHSGGKLKKKNKSN